ncbi:hypothetical protein [uncultured Vibrio sp.]|uniref:hypothetical protein n=1 Tax=uncultured Vibrio sp. TaxID=114054 RepID=UPI0025F2BBAE|nr:hypothetical protein [uncultured Vibrio sp.]
MSVAAIIHRPCPDLPHFELNAEQKSAGLTRLAKVKAQLKESQLKDLRTERLRLSNQIRITDTPREAVLLQKQIDDIDAKAIRISERWS